MHRTYKRGIQYNFTREVKPAVLTGVFIFSASGYYEAKWEIIMEETFVYILASQRNGTLYIGSTCDLVKRVWEHKNHFIPGFTAKYDVHQLVYYEAHQNIMAAAQRERRLKKWHREWKLNLIEKDNPTWRDLYADICV